MCHFLFLESYSLCLTRTKPGGALPYVGQYNLPVNRPPCLCKFYIHGPCFSLQSTPNDPLFSKFQHKISNFSCPSCAFLIYCQFCAKNGKFSLKFDKIFTGMTPILGSSHKRKPNFFFGFHTYDPLFSTKSYTECPSRFRSPVGTYLSLSYSSAVLPHQRFFVYIYFFVIDLDQFD